MERASNLRDVSQIEAQIEKLGQQPRQGQRQVLIALASCGRSLNIKLPTGYGKTFTAMASYSVLKSAGEVNRLLVVFPTDAQLVQFEETIPKKWESYAIDGPNGVCDVRYFGASAIKKHQTNTCQVYAITVQSLIGSRGMDNIATLLSKGRWMVVVDEYHHYGIDKPFGQAIMALNFEFLLCMSATPYRPGDDSAFGAPAISVSYRDAVKQNAVKPLRGHAYHYKIDAVNGENDVVSFTTEELIAEAGGDSPNAIKRLLIDRKLRWSPKYISPLVTNPIERMLTERIRTGYRLQVIVGAMCVSHAELVCEQISSTFPDLTVDWVGTGEDGKTPEANQSVIKRFAPTEGEPTLDILVHVGMAGEGLDTVLVSEVVHLNAASINNTNNQENGRAARFLPDVIGHINFDACSGFAKKDKDGKNYVGSAIMDAMDNLPPKNDDVCEKCGEPMDKCTCEKTGGGDWWDLPEEPMIRIIEVECTSIDSGDSTVRKMANWFLENVNGFSREDLDNKDSDIWSHAIHGVKMMREQEAASHNEKSTIKQWEESVKNALSTVAGNVVRLLRKNGASVDKSLAGDIKKRINGRKKREIGQIEKDIAAYKKHYNWLKNLEVSLKDSQEIPTWLS
jgi:superfamily II DNA or RNA helicase